MLADGTAVWILMRVEAWANALPLASTVPAVPAATPFNSERRNMQPPLRNRSGPRALIHTATRRDSCGAAAGLAHARDTIGDLRRARHRFDRRDASSSLDSTPRPVWH